MDYVNLGSTGLKVSRLCLGMMTYGAKKWRDWVLDEDESRPFIKRALDAGINFFDTADVYSDGASEEITGRALKHFGVRRDRSSSPPRCSTRWATIPTSAACRGSTSCTASTTRSAGSRWTTSTSTRSTASTTRRRSRRRSRR